jgi:hypothetical protein
MMNKPGILLLLFTTALAGCVASPGSSTSNDRAAAMNHINQRIAARAASPAAVKSSGTAIKSSGTAARSSGTKQVQAATPVASSRKPIEERAARTYTGTETGRDEIKLNLYD